jgi:hypothetical protein
VYIFLELYQIILYMFRALLESCCSTLESKNSFLKVHTAHIAAPYNCSQHNQVASHEVLTSLVFLSPDDGHNNARNM